MIEIKRDHGIGQDFYSSGEEGESGHSGWHPGSLSGSLGPFLEAPVGHGGQRWEANSGSFSLSQGRLRWVGLGPGVGRGRPYMCVQNWKRRKKKATTREPTRI